MSNIKTASEEYFERENRKHNAKLWGQLTPQENSGLNQDTVNKAFTRPTWEERAKIEAEEQAEKEAERKADVTTAWKNIDGQLFESKYGSHSKFNY